MFKYIVKILLPVLLFSLQDSVSASDGILTVGGTVTGNTTWCADTVKVTKHVVLYGNLTICPGTYVEFQGCYGIYINGNLKAIGEEGDSIYFTIKDTSGFYKVVPDYYWEEESKLGAWSGIVFFDQADTVLIDYCVFEYAKRPFVESEELEGVIYFWNCDSVKLSRIENSVFRHNKAKAFYSAYHYINSIFRNTTFYDNIDAIVIIARPSRTSVHNCVFRSNGNRAICFDEEDDFEMENSHIENHVIGITGYLRKAVLRNNTFLANKSAYSAYGESLEISGNIFNSNDEAVKSYAKVVILNNIFQLNKVALSLWGTYAEILGNEFQYNDKAVSLAIGNLLFDRNILHHNGQAIEVEAYGNGQANFTNNLIYRNESATLPVINLKNHATKLYNNTLVFNSGSDGTLIEINNSDLLIKNCILWGNDGEDAELMRILNPRLGQKRDIEYSLIKGLDKLRNTFEVKNSFDADPRLADPEQDDFRLAHNSPCINTGSQDTTGLYLYEADLAGNPRIFGGILDMGAYEYQSVPANRAPILQKTDTIYAYAFSNNEVSINYFDLDPQDSISDTWLSARKDNLIFGSVHTGREKIEFSFTASDSWSGVTLIYLKVSDTDGNMVFDTIPVIVSKEISGTINRNMTWCGDTVKVTDHVIIEGNLTICPGTYVEFQGYHGMGITGNLRALGGEGDSIYFTVKDTSGFYKEIPEFYWEEEYKLGGWMGISLFGQTDTVLIDYCVFEFAKMQQVESEELAGVINFGNLDSVKLSRIENSVFRHNKARAFFMGYHYINSIFRNTTFYDNMDGIVIIAQHTRTRVQNCVFRSNGNIAISFDDEDDFEMENSHIENHVIGISGTLGKAVLHNNTFLANKLAFDASGESLEISGNIFKSNDKAVRSGGENVVIINNKFQLNEVALSLSGTNVEISGNEFQYNDKAVSLAIENLLFDRNILHHNGQAIDFSGIYSIYGNFTNNLIYENASATLPVISLGNSHVNLTNNTLVENSGGDGTLIEIKNSDLAMTNCILWNENDGESDLFISVQSQDNDQKVLIVNSLISNPDLLENLDYYSDIIDADPAFVDPGNYDFHLSNSSPCINAGLTDTLAVFYPETDLEGNPRISDLFADIGAYEFTSGDILILEQPVSKITCTDIPAYLSTNAAGGVTAYQWQHNGLTIPQVTDRFLSVTHINAETAGTYNCLIAFGDSIVSTDTARLVKLLAPRIMIEEAAFDKCGLSDTMLTTSVIPEEFLEYQWYLNNLPIAGAQGNTLDLSFSQEGFKGMYQVKAENMCGIDSSEKIFIRIFPKPIVELNGPYYICDGDFQFLSPGNNFEYYRWSDGSDEWVLLATETGTYSVTVSNENGCLGQDSATVNVLSPPHVSLGGDTSIYINDMLMLDAGSGFDSYDWNTGFNGQVIEVEHSEPGTYTYWVSVEDENSCIGVDSISVTVDRNTLIPYSPFGTLLRIYPNPSQGILYLVPSEMFTGDIYLEIRKLNGELVYQEELSGLNPESSVELSLLHLLPGPYLLLLNKLPYGKLILLPD